MQKEEKDPILNILNKKITFIKNLLKDFSFSQVYPIQNDLCNLYYQLSHQFQLL